MKSKKFGKKLFLNKKTITNLSNNELGNAGGGGGVNRPSETEYVTYCGTCPTDGETYCGTCFTCVPPCIT